MTVPADEEAARLEATVHGQVQGVGFRWFVAREANRLGLTGWVANRQDGTVSVAAEGRRDALERLLGVLRSGPPAARVQRVEHRLVPASGADGRFEVRSGAHRGD